MNLMSIKDYIKDDDTVYRLNLSEEGARKKTEEKKINLLLILAIALIAIAIQFIR
jgi:hypothetical protein